MHLLSPYLKWKEGLQLLVQEPVALLPAKYLLQFGFNPTVYEVEDGVGVLWRHTMEFTRLQNNKQMYQFLNFPWHSSIKQDNPKFG
ncbi:hypothetical protein CR513_62310, partial [Mucuna pruriens]